MPSHSSQNTPRLSTVELRRSIRWAYANGALWGMGNGLASVTLVIYLATEYDVSPMGISWLIAIPAFVGLLRLLTPYWLERVSSRRKFCIGMFLASAVVLFALPIISAPHVLPLPGESVAALAITWAGYHVLEYIGTVALWSWYGDLVPRRVRGRFVGWRQSWSNAGKVLGTLIAAVGTYLWHKHCEQTAQPNLKWQSYACCGLAGGIMFALSAWPLARMHDLPMRRSSPSKHETLRQQLFAPWADRKFRRLLRFGLWFSFSNGLIQSAQWVVQTNVLKLSFVHKTALNSSSRGIQSLLMPSVGDWVDRHGNVAVLTIAQSIIAMAPIFFLIATPEARWWIIGAYVCWLAYAGENVAQPNLMLGLSPRNQTAAYASAWFAWIQLAYSISVLLGGALLNYLEANYTYWQLGNTRIGYFTILFLASMVLKFISAYWAARIRE